MNKKGSEILTVGTLTEVVLLTIVVALLYLVVAREISGTKFEKMYLAKDMAMFIDTLYASPNDIMVRYPQPTQDFAFKFEEGKVTVYIESEGTFLGRDHSFIEDPNIEFKYTTIKPSDAQDLGIEGNAPIIFSKTDTEIRPFLGIFTDDIT